MMGGIVEFQFPRQVARLFGWKASCKGFCDSLNLNCQQAVMVEFIQTGIDLEMPEF
jgi:hypothetical protein